MNDDRKDWKPTAEEIEEARNAKVDDIIDDDLDILFCGINPGLYSGAAGHHFARPGNRFWKALHRSGLTRRLLEPDEEEELLELRIGITNLVNRATAKAAELDERELTRGAEDLESKVDSFRPSMVAILGLSAYRTAFDRGTARAGKQEQKLAGSELWVFPNPSGINAHYQLPDFVSFFSDLKDARPS